jgi:hypothetical protein
MTLSIGGGREGERNNRKIGGKKETNLSCSEDFYFFRA